MSEPLVKYCTGCETLKPTFMWHNPRKYGVRGKCKDCNENARLQNLYGITTDQKNQMLKDQGNSCAICGGRAKLLVVDHCHNTGKVRGLLCTKCNTAIGKLGDDPVTLRKALAYLENEQ